MRRKQLTLQLKRGQKSEARGRRSEDRGQTATPESARTDKAELKRRAELQAKIETWQRLMKAARKRYRRANLLLEAIVGELGVHEPLEFDDGRRAIVLDAFATKITAFKPVGFDRYTIQVSK